MQLVLPLWQDDGRRRYARKDMVRAWLSRLEMASSRYVAARTGIPLEVVSSILEELSASGEVEVMGKGAARRYVSRTKGSEELIASRALL